MLWAWSSIQPLPAFVSTRKRCRRYIDNSGMFSSVGNGHAHRPAMFIVTLTYLKPVEEIDALMDAHVAWLKRHYDEGLFIASGRRVPRTGGVILARSGDEAALRAALAA